MDEKGKREELINRMLEENPEMRRTERAIFALLLIYTLIRVIPAVLHTIYIFTTGSGKTEGLMDYIMILLCCLFAVMVAQGVRFFALLGAICSVYSVAFLWLDRMLGPMNIIYTPLYSAYTDSVMVVSAMQLVIMLFILLSKRCVSYLTLLDSVNKDYFDSNGIR